jgi:hypothetical protein
MSSEPETPALPPAKRPPRALATGRFDFKVGIKGRPISARRKKAYLDALAACGSRASAARMVSPGLSAAKPGYSSFIALERSDPQFAADVQECLELARGRAEIEATRRALEGTDEPIMFQGRQVGIVKRFSDSILMRLLEKLDPTWIPQSRSSIDAKIDQRQAGMFVGLTAQDLLNLPAEERAPIVEALRKIVAAREGEKGTPDGK